MALKSPLYHSFIFLFELESYKTVLLKKAQNKNVLSSVLS